MAKSPCRQGLTNVVAVAAGSYHSLALRADGTVAAWGNNEYGQTTVPAGLTNVVAVAAGGYHSLALRADGMIAVWGYNGYGQTTVPTWLSNVVALAGGYSHSLAVIGVGAPVVAPMVDHLEVAADLPFFLRVGATGERPMYFQWQRNGTPVAGATGAVLQATGPTGSVEEYRCVVSNAVGVATSATCRVVQPVQILSQTLPGGMEMTPYYAKLTGTNGFPPYTWVTPNEIPPGLSWSGDGVISGLPTLAGTYPTTFVIRDSAGHSAEREIAIVIAPNPNKRPISIIFRRILKALRWRNRPAGYSGFMPMIPRMGI